MTKKEYFEDLLIKGNLDRAINEVLVFSRNLKNETISNNLILLNARKKRLENQNNIGVLLLKEYNLELNKISKSLLDYLNELFD